MGADDVARRVLRECAEANYCYRIVDDVGLSVPFATARVFFSSYGRSQDNASWEVVADNDGRLEIVHRFNERFVIDVRKTGYYSSREEIFYLGMRTLPFKDGRWQPSGEVRTLMLKKIRHPRELQCHHRDYYK